MYGANRDIPTAPPPPEEVTHLGPITVSVDGKEYPLTATISRSIDAVSGLDAPPSWHTVPAQHGVTATALDVGPLLDDFRQMLDRYETLLAAQTPTMRPKTIGDFFHTLLSRKFLIALFIGLGGVLAWAQGALSGTHAALFIGLVYTIWTLTQTYLESRGILPGQHPAPAPAAPKG